MKTKAKVKLLLKEEKKQIFIKGKMEKKLKYFPDECIDCVVTDPPYGYSFMGKDWDKAVPSIKQWKEVHRVLKSGAFAFIMSAPRQDVLSRMIYNLQEAGFVTSFTSIYWTYNSGFPKAMNMGKMVDKKLGNERKSAGMSNSKGIRSGGNNYVGDKYDCKGYEITKGNSPLEGSYAGFQPKPALEVIIVVMKPISEKNYIEQAMKNGKGITWLDGCRIPYNSDKDKPQDADCGWKRRNATNQKQGFRPNAYVGKDETWVASNNGRFPANLLVSDNMLDNGTTSKSPSGETKRQPRQAQVFTDKTCGFKSENLTESGYGDEGSLSRYYDLDKWFEERIKNLPKEVRKIFPYLYVPKASQSEKNEGCESLETKKNKYHQIGKNTGLKCSKCDKWKSSGNPCKCEKPEFIPVAFNTKQMQNEHPTVKPIKLFEYLIVLGSQKNDIVLDPFCGSGTTAIPCHIENRRFVGIEMNKKYYKIAKTRVEHAYKTKLRKQFG